MTRKHKVGRVLLVFALVASLYLLAFLFIGGEVRKAETARDDNTARIICLAGGYPEIQSVKSGRGVAYFCVKTENGSDVVRPVDEVE